MPGPRWIAVCTWLVVGAFSTDTATGYPCGWPGRPLHGDTTPVSQLFYTGESANITCNDGYVRFGQPRRTCTADGTWDNLMPFCRPNLAYGGSAQGPRPPLAEPAGRPLGRFDPALAVDGDTNTCSSAPRELPERWWQVRLPTRSRVESVGLIVPADSVLELSVFVISLGRTPETADYQLCANFSGSLPQQKRLFRCGHEGLLGEYVYIRDERPHRDYFTLCEVEVFQFREQRECGDPEVPAHGHVTRPDAKTADYRCQPGHRLAGHRRRRCSRGEWTGQQPVCRRVFCERPPPLENGFLDGTIPSLTRYPYNATARYRCAPGFSMQGGSGSRTCNINSRWTGTAPRCQPLVCPMPVAPPGMQYQLLNGTTRWHALVQYTCRHGFIPDEDSKVPAVSRCEDSALWQTVNTSCVPAAVPIVPAKAPPVTQLEVTPSPPAGKETATRPSVAVRGPDSDQEKPMNSGVVAGLAIAAVIAIAAMIIVGIVFTRKRFWIRRKRSSSGSPAPPVDNVKTYDTVYEPSYQNVPQGTTPALASFRGTPGQARITPVEPPYETLKARLAAGDHPDVEDAYEPVAGCRLYDEVANESDSGPYQSLGKVREPDYETLRAKRRDDGDYDLVPERCVGASSGDSAQPNYENCQFGPAQRASGSAQVPDLLQGAARSDADIPPEILALYAKVIKSKKTNRDSCELVEPAAATAARGGDSACPSSPGSSAASSYTRNMINRFNKLAKTEAALEEAADDTPTPSADEKVHYSELDRPTGSSGQVQAAAAEPVVYSSLRPLPPVPPPSG